MEPPRRTVNRTPDYPAIARAAAINGVVILEVIVDERGNVMDATVLHSIAVLDQSALDAGVNGSSRRRGGTVRRYRS